MGVVAVGGNEGCRSSNVAPGEESGRGLVVFLKYIRSTCPDDAFVSTHGFCPVLSIIAGVTVNLLSDHK